MVQLRAYASRHSQRQAAARLIACVRVCFIALLVGCHDDPSSPPSSPKTSVSKLRVTVSTSGADVDTDGYMLSIDQTREPVQVGSNGSVTFYGIGVGTYHLALTGLAPNCVLDPGTSEVAVLSPGLDMSADLHVTCSAFGSVRVTVATTGDDRDPNGFAAWVNGPAISYSANADIPANDGTGVVRVPAGHYTVQLRGVAANCDGADLGPRELDVVSAATDTLDFAIVCKPARRLAFVTGLNTPNAEIYTVRSDGTGLVYLTNNNVEDTDPAWSPDGTRIAFTSTRDGPHAIYVMNENGSNVNRLTPVTWDSFRPAWSPDGSRIAFVSARNGNTDVYVMKADGTGEQRLTTHMALDTDPAWSPDGSKIAFASERDGNAEIYVMNADGSGVTRLTTNSTEDRHPAWSPDGTRLAFSTTHCGNPNDAQTCYPTIFVVGPSGPPVMVGTGDDPAWSPDGRQIAVTGVSCYDYYYYYYGECSITGLGILVPFTNGTPGSQPAWDPQLTSGQHGQPTWRP